jgi:hypothetical protein
MPEPPYDNCRYLGVRIMYSDVFIYARNNYHKILGAYGAWLPQLMSDIETDRFLFRPRIAAGKMTKSNGPRSGTKLEKVNSLLRRPNGATLAEINEATNQNAWSYKTNGHSKRYGGTFGTNDNSGTNRRFWIR